ncbi:MAG: ABC transporter permease [Promethearchaeota archaeon]
MTIIDVKREIQAESNTSNIINIEFFRVLKNVKFFFFLDHIDREIKDIQLYSDIKRSNGRTMKSLKSFLFIIGLTIVFCLVNIAIFQDWFSYRTKASGFGLGWLSNKAFSPPSPQHPLGTTFSGFDVLARLIFGTRYTLIVILVSTLISVFAGIIIGLISAFYGGWLDMIVMRIMDILMSFPGVVFAILFLLILGRTYELTIIAFGIIGLPYFSRVVRSCVLKEKELPYIQAAKVIGAKKMRIMFLHILPNCYQSILVSTAFNVGKVLLGLTVLAFLGFNRIPFFWGQDIISVMNYVYTAPWAIFWPVVMIIITIMGFLLLGDGLRETFSLKTEQI